MTSLVACGLSNAFAFVGAGFLFSKFNQKGYEAEKQIIDLLNYSNSIKEISDKQFLNLLLLKKTIV